MSTALLLELFLRGIAIGALVATGAGLVRTGTSLAIRLVAGGFVMATVAYVLNSSPEVRAASGPGLWFINFLGLAGGGWLWLFIVTLFEDRKLTAWSFAPVVLLTVVGLAGWREPGALRSGIWIAHNLFEIGLGLHALTVIVTSWRGDMVEERRKMRGPFLTMVVALTFVFSAVEIGESFGYQSDWYPLLGATALAMFCMAGCVMFLQARPGLFGAPEAAPTNAVVGSNAADALEIARLETVMSGGAWRDENLTIAALADKVGVPEHRLRRLINDQLGHRNFVAYVNGHRIAAAKAMLTDPAKARTTVASIAFDLGYGSLGPFNRAFKEATGVTPTEWRRQASPNPSPNPENPG
jgi:AraC-like DNA-binding protein